MQVYWSLILYSATFVLFMPSTSYIIMQYNNMYSIHSPMSVFPVPGGPNSRIPFGGPRRPLNISLHNRHGIGKFQVSKRENYEIYSENRKLHKKALSKHGDTCRHETTCISEIRISQNALSCPKDVHCQGFI